MTERVRRPCARGKTYPALPGSLGTPPYGHYGPCARSSLYGAGHVALRTQARPGVSGEVSTPPAKTPRWSAERRARLARRASRFTHQVAQTAYTCLRWRETKRAPLGAPSPSPVKAQGPDAASGARKRAARTPPYARPSFRARAKPASPERRSQTTERTLH